MQLVHTFPGAVNASQVHGSFEDFYGELVTGDKWTTLVADTGTAITYSDAAGGIIVLSTSATDNDEVAIFHNAENYKFAADKPAVFVARMGVVEANTDDSNIFMGLVDAPGADLMVDDGAGPKTTASAMAFEKRDGDTEWRAFSSKSTTQTSTLLQSENKNNISGVDQTVHSSGPTHQDFRIEFHPETSTKGHIDYFIDDVHVAKHDNFDFSSATEMSLVLYCKAGGANDEVPQWDYAGAWQKR